MKHPSAPAWSISPRRPIRPKEEVPGPGAYEAKGALSATGTRVGSSKRSDLAVKTTNPGPGAYSPSTRPKTTGAVFGTSGRSKLEKGGEIPGPGTYAIPSKATEGPSWGIKGRYKPRADDQKPGPGAYEVAPATAQTEKLPSWSFTKSKQRSDLPPSQAPGPGEYSPSRVKESPTWVFGRGAKGEPPSKSKEFPAPGNYDLPDTLDRKSYSISGRHPDLREKHTAFVPGPGTYSPAITSDNPQFSVGKSSRWKEDNRKHEVPGPGAYDHEAARPRSTSVILGRSQRQGITTPSAVPGPGTYAVQKEKEGPLYSFAGKHEVSSKMNNPGPGQYEHANYTYLMERPASAVWGAEHSSRKEKSLNHTLPGPGEYNPGDRLGEGPNYSFGNEKRKWLKEDSNPGPGTYSIKPTIDQRSASISGRHPLKDYKVVPGPGAYEVRKEGAAPSYSVGRGPRSDLRSSAEAPGPGQYPVRDSLSQQGVRIGTGKRDAGEHASQNPGPGNYPAGTTIGEGPSYSLRGKFYRDPKNEVPGPGTYNQAADFLMEKSPSVQFGRESKDGLKEKSTDSTGPGMYYSPGKVAGAKWSFGNEKKGTVIKSDVPGPGTYELKSTISDLPSYSQRK